MNEQGSRTIGFCNQYITINCNGPEAISIVDFICSDLLIETDLPVCAVYDVMIVGNKPMMSLWQGEKQLYFGDCGYTLAYTLINEIIYQCLADNAAGLAIHAAAIAYHGNGILLPGKSGCGKSTLAAWLTAKGCNYLTDELVVIAEEAPHLQPFTRPISIKSGSAGVLSSLLSFDNNKVLAGADGFMLPHHLVNDNYSATEPPLSLILFPQYVADVTTEITEMTSGEACSRLIECYVNAKNFRGHGISRLAELTRQTPVYQMIYGNLNTLESILPDLFSDIMRISTGSGKT